MSEASNKASPIERLVMAREVTVNLEQIAALINEIKDDQSGMCASFPEMKEASSVDLTGFSEQASVYTGVDVEYVNQSGCGDYGFHGQIAVPVGESYLIIWDYSE